MIKVKSRYSHIRLLLISIVNIIFAIKTLNVQVDRISLVSTCKLVFVIVPLLVATVSLVILALKLFKVQVNFNIDKLMNICYLINLAITLIFVLEFIVLPVLQSFIDTSQLNKIPQKDAFLDSMTYIIINHADDFLKGIIMTLELSLLGTIIGLIIAFLFAIIRTIPINKKDNEFIAFLKLVGIKFVKLYVTVFRGTPMMVQAVIIYYLLPMFIAKQFGIPQAEVDKILTITVSGIIIVSLNTTAYLTEVLRGGIETVDKGQMEAARSLGFKYSEAMFHIILPQAIKNSLPAICNEFIINIKDTSVLNVIAVAELFFVAQDIKQTYFRTYEPFIIAGLIYLFLTLTTTKIINFLEKKMSLNQTPLPSSN